MVEHVIFAEDLEEGALAQFNNASRLMPARKSALMPDAHQRIWFAYWWCACFR